jgi:hypothetical protein
MARKQGGKKADGEVTELDALAQTLGGGETEGTSDGQGTGDDVLDKEETIARLKACAARLVKAQTFSKGQLVQWKKGLKNKRTPAYGEPVIVVETLAQPVFDTETKSAGSPYFLEPLTLVAGELDNDGDFLCFHYDGRRFEPYKE